MYLLLMLPKINVLLLLMMMMLVLLLLLLQQRLVAAMLVVATAVCCCGVLVAATRIRKSESEPRLLLGVVASIDGQSVGIGARISIVLITDSYICKHLNFASKSYKCDRA